MASEELVKEQFEFLGIDVDSTVLFKCVKLCEEYNIDPEAFVEQWMAYSVSNLNGAPPTLEHLDSLERKEFSKLIVDHVPFEKTEAVIRSPPKLINVPVDGQSDQLLSNYISVPKKTIPLCDNQQSVGASSPSIGHPSKYSSRENSGAVLCSYGNESLLKSIDVPSDQTITNLDIKQVPNHDGEAYTKAMFGFELLQDKAGIYDNHISYLSQCIMKKASITETTSLRYKTQNEVFVCGRVECDADARLQPKCAVLQGCWARSLSQSVSLDLDHTSQYSLFPGQVVVVRGTNPRGDKFIAQEVYSDASLTIPELESSRIFKGTINLVVTSGPYTISDNLSYEPLKDLLLYIAKHKPHVVIMTGPFLDSDHQDVRSNKMSETFKTFFDKLLDTIAEVGNSSPWTRIYIVASLKDAFHLNIYPTPAYNSRRKHPNVHLIPDPCTLDLNGLIIGVTSTDILMHISQEEISHGAGGDKLSRLAAHVLGQQSYYPARAAAGLPLDAPLWAAHAHFTRAPHLLVLPSNFRYFIKDVKGCMVVNPEHLTKGVGGGTFARIQLKVDEDTTQISTKNIAAQIVRI